MPYKIVDDVEIRADVYFPEDPAITEPMPLALMIHGGGHMTLSRRAIRPHQTRFLLDNGYLPISIDYRLCPEIDLIAGPMSDVRDALDWVRKKLPGIARARGVVVDQSKIIAVGWSTGGHLAMTTAWTCEEVGQEPPSAILCFYGPIDFESEEIDRPRLEQYPERTLSLDQIRKSLSTVPASCHEEYGASANNASALLQITSYDSPTGTDSTNLGWVRPGDPRSDLVLSLFKEKHGLRVILNGISDAALASPPPLARIQAISPMAQLKAGRYKVPTFVIHSDGDEIVPFGASEAFVDELKRRGVRGGLGRVKGKEHIHDLALKPGDEGWQEGVGVVYAFLFQIVDKGVR